VASKRSKNESVSYASGKTCLAASLQKPEARRRAKDALHRFAEWLEQELADAVAAARGRRLAPLRYVVQVCRFVQRRHMLGEVNEAVSRPSGLTVEPDLPAALRQVDLGAMAACINGFAQIEVALEPFEGQSFPRKQLILNSAAKKAAARRRAATVTESAEDAALAALEDRARGMVSLLHDAVAVLAEHVDTKPPGETRPPGDDREMYTPPQLAKKLAVGQDKIYAWIRSNRLKAINAAKTPGGRPRYLISQAAVDDFLKRAQVETTSAAPKRSRNSNDPNVTKYF